MLRLNFLSRHLEREKKLSRIYKLCFFIAILFNLVCGSILHCLYLRKEAQMQEHVQLLNLEKQQKMKYQNILPMQALDGETKEAQAALLAHHHWIQQLFLNLQQSQAEHVCFSSMRHAALHTVVFTGEADSAFDLSRFLLGWRTEHLFSDIKIEKLKASSNQKLTFRLLAREKT
jgi:hypothetical protein